MPFQRLFSPVIGCALALLFNSPNLASHSRAAEVDGTVLEGDWVRVADGCADLPLEVARALPQTGGGNRIRRTEFLSFRGDTFRARILPAPRCMEDTSPTGPELGGPSPVCSGGSTTGRLTLKGENHFTLDATQASGMSGWGTRFHEYDFNLIDNQVLFVHGGEPIDYCPDGNFRVYFIRATAT